MPFRSPPLLIPGGFGRKICIESESGRVTVRKGRGMKNISGSESESNWSGSVHTLRNSVRQRTEDRTFSKKWIHCLLKLDGRWDVYLKGGWLSLFWHFVTNRVFSSTWFQFDSFPRGWRTFPHFSERSLIFVRGIFHSLLLDDGRRWSNFEEGKKKASLGIVKSKNKKKEETERKFSFHFDCHRSTVIHCDCYFHWNDKACWA